MKFVHGEQRRAGLSTTGVLYRNISFSFHFHYGMERIVQRHRGIADDGASFSHAVIMSIPAHLTSQSSPAFVVSSFDRNGDAQLLPGAETCCRRRQRACAVSGNGASECCDWRLLLLTKTTHSRHLSVVSRLFLGKC